MTDTAERPVSGSESPDDAPDIPAPELLQYLRLPAYPPDRSGYRPGEHQARRAEAAALEAASNAVWGEPADVTEDD